MIKKNRRNRLFDTTNFWKYFFFFYVKNTVDFSRELQIFFESLSITHKHNIKKSRWNHGYFWRKKNQNMMKKSGFLMKTTNFV
jgi:hypothetical protein